MNQYFDSNGYPIYYNDGTGEWYDVNGDAVDAPNNFDAGTGTTTDTSGINTTDTGTGTKKSAYDWVSMILGGGSSIVGSIFGKTTQKATVPTKINTIPTTENRTVPPAIQQSSGTAQKSNTTTIIVIVVVIIIILILVYFLSKK